MNTYELLVAARDVFAEEGGAKHMLRDCDGKVCAVGAINMADHGYPEWIFSPMWTNSEQDVTEARIELDKHTPSGYIVGYNNEELTTKQDVLDVYDKTIAAMEEKV